VLEDVGLRFLWIPGDLRVGLYSGVFFVGDGKENNLVGE
jgi:hypothetical protein